LELKFSQPLEWAEFPIIVDLFVILAFVLMLVQFVRPILRMPAGDLYVSGWYIVGGLVFTCLAYPIGNLVPQLVAGAKGAAFSGLWIHDAVGLFVTPLAHAMAYYVIPSVTRKPIYSHFISMMGFWLLFFIYPLNGTHHYVYSAIPMSAQRGAIIASIYLELTVILVVANLLLSLRGSTDKVGGNVPLRFVWFGVVAHLIVSLAGIDAGDHAGESVHSLFRLGDRPLPSRYDWICELYCRRRLGARLEQPSRRTLQRAGDGLGLLVAGLRTRHDGD
jgi:cbb3-type cytochrome oxidase subunit 1